MPYLDHDGERWLALEFQYAYKKQLTRNSRTANAAVPRDTPARRESDDRSCPKDVVGDEAQPKWLREALPSGTKSKHDHPELDYRGPWMPSTTARTSLDGCNVSAAPYNRGTM